MREIYSLGAGGMAGRVIGGGEPGRELQTRWRSDPADPAVWRAVAELAEIYAYPERPDRPWVRANMVTSADGAGALQGRTAGLSGPADRLVFFLLRSLADVILVGAGTARDERYRKALARHTWPVLRAGRLPTPPIAVLTRRLELDFDGPLLADGDGLARTIVITTEAAPADRRSAAAKTADVIVAGERDVTATALLVALAEAGHSRILTEGGPSLLGNLIAADLLDELCLTIGPALEGGYAGRIAVGGRPDQAATPLALAGVVQDEDYLLLRYWRRRAAAAPERPD